MWVHESIYNTVPGVYIAFGLFTIYFGSEAYLLGRSLWYTVLLFMSGIALIICGLLVMRLRRKKSVRASLLSQNHDLTP